MALLVDFDAGASADGDLDCGFGKSTRDKVDAGHAVFRRVVEEYWFKEKKGLDRTARTLGLAIVLRPAVDAGHAPSRRRAAEEYWYYNVDTTKYPDGPLTIMVMACDTRGNRNEQGMVTITVANRAELEIVAVDWVDMTLTEGETAKVQVRVRNAGHTVAKDFRVELISGGETLAYTEELTGIQSGKEHTYTLEWKAKGTGNKVVRIEVDTTNAIEEGDETNNAWEQQTLTITSEGSDVPGAGVMMAMLAITVTAVVSLGRRR